MYGKPGHMGEKGSRSLVTGRKKRGLKSPKKNSCQKKKFGLIEGKFSGTTRKKKTEKKTRNLDQGEKEADEGGECEKHERNESERFASEGRGRRCTGFLWGTSKKAPAARGKVGSLLEGGKGTYRPELVDPKDEGQGLKKTKKVHGREEKEKTA